MFTRSRIIRSLTTRAIPAAIAVALLLPARLGAQVSEEEHLKHHPPQSPAPAGSAAPSPAPQGSGMQGMGEMMSGMHGVPPKQLYPTLMSLPALTPEERQKLEQQAEAQMRGGTALMDKALGQLGDAQSSNNFAAMHDAIARLHEGMAQFDAGIAGKRALAEGKPPREVALDWFRRELSLPTIGSQRHAFGGAAFHVAIIAILAAFPAAMIALYFARMRRANDLLRSLTGAGQASTSVAAVAPATAAQSPSAAESTQLPIPKKWSGNLRVAAIFQETPNVKTFRLMNPIGGAVPFNYLPGQFITVAVPLDGKPVKRSYTIASSPTQHDFAEITVKREETGQVSAFLHDQVKIGDLLAFSGPSGAFTFTGDECNCILLIAGGVGITPLMSVLRYLIDRSWPGDIFLLYSIPHPEDFIFREEIEYMERRHPNLRVAVTASRADGTDWKRPRGRISKELILQTVPDVAKRYVHICGPVPMMQAMKQLLADLGVPKDRVKTEAFGPVLGKPEPQIRPTQPTAAVDAAGTRLPTVSFSLSDKSAPLPADKTVLDVADEVGVNIDNSCRVGTCGTCRVKLLKGAVTMEVQDGLEPGDREKNIILACQAKSIGNVTIEA